MSPILCGNTKSRCLSTRRKRAREVAGCIERYGVTPTVLFDKLGMYDYGGGAFHCVHMSDEDIAIFKTAA